MATGIIDIMKRAALDANEAQGYTDLKYGTVSSVNPLAIRITPSFILPKEVLIVPEHLTDHTVSVNLSGDKTMTIKNALKVNDRVVLIREHGGGRYLVIDRF